MSTHDGGNITLKELKEAFVTGHTGTSRGEVLLVSSFIPVAGIFFFLQFSSDSKTQHNKNNNNNNNYNAFYWNVAKEIWCLWIPVMIGQTDFLYPYGVTLFVLLFGLSITKCLSRKRSRSQTKNEEKLDNDDGKDKPIRGRNHAFLTCYRSCVLYSTFIAILAVDFNLFPRRFAKTETEGVSLMDIGAASFVISAGMVSPYARNHRTSFNVKKSIPLLTLGLIRLLTTKGIEYQEHVSEYGVHWNFFFTLFLVTITSHMSRKFVINFFEEGKGRKLLQNMYPIFLLVLYQSFLSYHEIQNFIEDAPRFLQNNSIIHNFFYANREGILGSIGYLAMYGMSENIASFCLWGDHDYEQNYKKTDEFKTKKEADLRNRMFCCLLSFLLMDVALNYYMKIPVSRRSTNASFCVWAIFLNLLFLSSIFLAFELSPNSRKKTPPILNAINRNGLLMFLIANLLTGAVNLSINTLEVNQSQALFVLFVYLTCLAIVSLFFDKVLDKTIKI